MVDRLRLGEYLTNVKEISKYYNYTGRSKRYASIWAISNIINFLFRMNEITVLNFFVMTVC